MIDNSTFVQHVQREMATSFRGKLKRYYTQACRCLIRLLPGRFDTCGKPSKSYTYMTICKKRGMDMVEASLYSLYKNAPELPNRIAIVSDGSWEPEYGVKHFKKRGLDVECFSWQECADYYKESLPSLATWAQKHIWGKKMAAILYFSETDATLFSDPDVLWYNSPLHQDEWEHTAFKVSIDCCHSYDDKYIKASDSQALYDTADPINCGVVYIKGGLKLLNEQAKACIDYQAEHCGNFAEQTVFAIMDQQFNSRWSREEVISSIDDILNPLFSKSILYPDTIARHYLWELKWIYWTEYFKMRWFGR